MRRFFLILLVLISLSFAYSNFTYFDPTFNKPWESVLIIDSSQAGGLIINEFDDQADVSVSYLNDLDQQTANDLRDAITRAHDADETYVDILNTKNEMISKTMEILEITSIMGGAALASLLLEQWEVLIVIAGAGTVEVTSQGFELMDLVKEYYSNLIDSVQKSEEACNIVLSKVNYEYSELDKMGVLSDKYSGQSYNDISWVKSSISSINLQRFIEREESLKSNLDVYSTSISVYDTIIKDSKAQIFGLLDGDASALNTLINIYLREKTIKENVLNERISVKSSVSRRYSELQDSFKSVKNDYGDFTESDVVYFRIASVQTLDTPYDHIKSAEMFLKHADENIKNGDNVYSSGAQGYVAHSISLYYDAADDLDSASFEISMAKELGDFILSSAETTTENEYNKAVSEASSFVPSTSAEQDQLNSANALIDNAGNLLNKHARNNRERMNNLKQAYHDAILARSYLSSTSMFYSNVRSDALYKLDYLKKVIDLARSDGVDVSYEQHFYEQSKIEIESGNLPASQIINISLQCSNFADRIYSRASTQYSFLGIRFSELSPYLKYFAEMDGKYPSQYISLKNYLNADGSINVHKALGHYGEISSLINSLYSQVHVRSKALITQSLEMNSRTSVVYANSSVYLDEPVVRRISFTTHSGLDLVYASPFTITIPFDYDVMGSKLVANPFNLDYSISSNRLTVMIPEYERNAQYVIIWEDNRVLAQTLSEKRIISSVSPSQADVLITRQIKSSGVPELRVHSFLGDDYAYDLYLDGVYIGRFYGDGIISRQVPAGKHTVIQKYSIHEPYVVHFDSVSSTSSSSIFEGYVKNTAPIDIQDATIKTSLPISHPQSLTITSSNCGVSNYDYVSTQDSTEITVQFSVLPSGYECSLSVHALSPINQQEIQDIIDEIFDTPTADSSAIQYAESAQYDLDAGNLDDAYEKINKAKQIIAENAANAEKEERINSTLQSYNKSIYSLISDLSSVKDDDVNDIVSKARMYYDAHVQEQDSSKKLQYLRKADRELSKVNSIAYERVSLYEEKLNDIKQRWLYLVDKGYAESIPQEILSIEHDLSILSIPSHANSTTFTKLNNIDRNISALDSKTSIAEKDEKRWESSLKSTYKNSLSMLKSYIAKLNNACSTACPPNLISYADSLMNLNPSTPSEYSKALHSINMTLFDISSYILSEKESANDAIKEVSNLINGITDYDEKQVLTKKLHSIESLYDKGKYYSAKQSALTLISAMQANPQSADNDYTLILAGIAVIIIAFIILKMKERNEGAQEEIKKILKKSDDHSSSSSSSSS